MDFPRPDSRSAQTALLIKPNMWCHSGLMHYSLTHPNHWIEVVQSHLWLQVYKIKHLGVCEKIELTDFQHDTEAGCHLCNKSGPEASSLLNILQTNVRGIITKWKRLGTTSWPQSGLAHSASTGANNCWFSCHAASADGSEFPIHALTQ